MQHKKELSLREYMERFSSEEKCAEYLIEKKWPQGFRCPKCGSKNAYYIKTRKKYQCKECKHQTSITAHTIMHRSHLPLTTWFTAIYFVACDKRGISAVSLAGKVDVCYETAWYMLVRIRKAMDMKEHEYMLEGTMEMDDSYFGAKIKGKEGRGAGNQSVMVAISKDSEGKPVHLKMMVTEDVKRNSVRQFLTENIAKGSVVETDGFRSYIQPLREGYTQIAQDFNPDSTHLLWIHTVIGNAKAFLNGTYHGTSTKYLQMYLSEYCFRFNRRFLHGGIFDHLIAAATLSNKILGASA
jgi:transposase-like protein